MNMELLGWATLWGFLWCQIVTHYGVSVGLHRYFAHNQFKTSVAHELGFIIMIMIACVRTPIGWVSSHRMHHADTEGPLDPHNYKEIGYWKVALTTWDIHHVPIKFARDLYKLKPNELKQWKKANNFDNNKSIAEIAVQQATSLINAIKGEFYCSLVTSASKVNCMELLKYFSIEDS